MGKGNLEGNERVMSRFGIRAQSKPKEIF